MTFSVVPQLTTNLHKVFDNTLFDDKELDDIADQAATMILDRIRKRFLDERDPTARFWPESQSAKIRRAGGKTYSPITKRHYSGTGTLFESGTLFNSIYMAKNGRNQRKISFDQTKAPHGVDHQLGLNGQIRRPFIGYNKTDLRDMRALAVALVQKRFERAIRGAAIVEPSFSTSLAGRFK